jgi:peptidoglycan hydrolase CwlO-like protein
MPKLYECAADPQLVLDLENEIVEFKTEIARLKQQIEELKGTIRDLERAADRRR